MRRHRIAEDNGRVSLFPFLAVLICTMGALLVLLVVISKRAQAKARAERETQLAEKQPVQSNDQDTGDSEQRLKELLEQIERLRQVRDKAEKALSERRDALSHIEDHTRRLNEERARLVQTLAQLEQQGGDDADVAKLKSQLHRISKQLAEAERLLAEEHERTKSRQTSFSIIPYSGPNETRRRPIYLECRSETIVLQPEGIVFEKRDLEGAIESDNPLAAAMRAVSESFARSRPNEIEQVGRPYPLLIVRPSSISAYYAGRRALQAWKHEFGYEMVNEEWEVEYPAPNPQLAQVVQQAVEVARRRQTLQRLAQRSGSRGGNSSVPSTRSGPGFGRFVQSGKSSTTGSPSGGATGRPGSSSRQNGQSGASQIAGAQQSGGRMSPGTPPAAIGRSSNPAAQATSHGASQNPLRTPANGGAGGSASFSSGTPQNQACKSISETRGKNWALPGAGNGLVAVTRPIRIECFADRLVVVGLERSARDQIISTPGPLRPEVEKFVSAVWDRMQSWGIAGRGLYWKPVLNVYVQPGAERRAGELKQLLDGSGLDIKLMR
jgi:hypothetical protein